MNISINNKLLLIKLHYFLFNAGIAPLIIFGPTIAKQTGIAAISVGMMYMMIPLIGLFAKTISSAIADKFNKKKLMFMLAIFACLISAFTMTIIRTPLIGKKITLLCHSETFLTTCNDEISNIRMADIVNRTSRVNINCKLKCEADRIFAREICNNWGECSTLKYLNGLASISTASTNVTFLIELEKKHIFKLKKCLYALVSEQKFSLQGNSTLKPVCEKHVNSTCSIICDNTEFMSALQYEEAPLMKDLKRLQFWIVFFVFTLNWFGMSLGGSMSDTVCFDILGNEPNKYGRQRLWGALGWGIVSILAGTLVDFFSKDLFIKNYEVFFYWSALLLFLDLIVACFIKVNKTCVSISIFRDIKLLFYSTKITVFAIWCFLTGLMSGIVWNFLFWFLEDISSVEDLMWSKTLQGLDSLFTTIFGELPFFFISGWFIKKLGFPKLMSFVLLAVAIRLLGYSILTTPVWVLPIELINGFAFSMCYVVIASYSYLIAPVGAESTIQALFSALFDGLGISFGGLVGGVIYHRYGGQFLFRFFGYFALIVWLLHCFIQIKFKNDSEKANDKRDSLENHNTTAARYSTPNDAILILESS